ncbi:YgfZ/GcvT domain-containing protein [Microvirga massiliensis]|uniref:CAF17-like 4Fe-4S cluster assembly/insertion protein YgfZ n=1 Tax=Microvirga massiliensis TaxID=1033741 RepID=UPI00062BAB49|nr:folate-binding protein YgfZ [Microvirga massiliensis]
MPTAHLTDRGVVRVAGEAAKAFLDGLLTCDLDRISPGQARFGALLTPQGKILFDFIVFESSLEPGSYRLDVLKPYVPDLVRRLTFYRLRAKVEIQDVSAEFAVIAGWDGAAKPDAPDSLSSIDPRFPALGWRAIVPAGEASAFTTASPEDYHVRRIVLGIPEGGRDFLFGDAFPHEAQMDQLHGIDFDKGCYVGQEVVSRMQHRGTARTRMVPVVYREGFVAEPGADIAAGDRVLGKTGTAARGRGLAMVRLDRAQDALDAGQPITAGGLPVDLVKPDWASFPFPESRAKAAE